MEPSALEIYSYITFGLLVFVLGPTVVLALLSTLFLFLWSRWVKQATNYKAMGKCFLATLAVQVGFVLVGGIVISKLFGKELSLATPIVVIALTWLTGLISFVYFVTRYNAFKATATENT